jgi:hypothetical protein
MLGPLDVLHALAWFAATIAGWWGLIPMRRTEDPFSQAPTHRVRLVVTVCSAALTWTCGAFLTLGVHPSKPYNAHTFEGRDIWVRVWSYLIFGIPVIGIGMLLTTPFRVRSRKRSRGCRLKWIQEARSHRRAPQLSGEKPFPRSRS